MATRAKPRTVKIWTSRPRPARLLGEGPSTTTATVTVDTPSEPLSKR